GGAEGGDERVLQGVGCFLRIPDGAQGDGPPAVSVSADELVERVRIAGGVRLDQIRSGRLGGGRCRPEEITKNVRIAPERLGPAFRTGRRDLSGTRDSRRVRRRGGTSPRRSRTRTPVPARPTC